MAPKTVKHRAKPASRSSRPTPRLAARTARKAASVKAVRAVTVGRPAVKGKPLSRREVTELRQVLGQERQRLMAELEAMEEHTPEVERSEEHTSELQSLAYLVCRLLLEKKKKK